MTASLLRGFRRPDGGMTSKLGSVQVLGDDASTSNVFINWAQSSYISEYDGENRMVLEAKLHSPRMWTYRAYKLPWVGLPTEPIALKGIPTMYGQGRPAVTYYVSWNGATEVKTWSFYCGDSPDGPFEKLMTVPKVGFETSWTTSKIRPYGYAEAVDGNGKVLGKSEVSTLTIGKAWLYANEASTPGSEAKAVADAFEEDMSEADEADEEYETFNPISTVVYLIIDGLALYALYALLKSLIPGLMKKRKGYLRVGSGDDESILGSTELSMK